MIRPRMVFDGADFGAGVACFYAVDNAPTKILPVSRLPTKINVKRPTEALSANNQSTTTSVVAVLPQPGRWA